MRDKLFSTVIAFVGQIFSHFLQAIQAFLHFFLAIAPVSLLLQATKTGLLSVRNAIIPFGQRFMQMMLIRSKCTLTSTMAGGTPYPMALRPAMNLRDFIIQLDISLKVLRIMVGVFVSFLNQGRIFQILLLHIEGILQTK